MGQCDAAGLKGPMCKYPSRYSLTPKDELDGTKTKVWRDEDGELDWPRQ